MFNNEEIDIGSIPTVKETSFNPLDKNYLNVMMVRAVIFAIIITIMFLIAFQIIKIKEIDLYQWPILIFLTLIICFNFYVSYFGYYKKSYKLRQHDIIYRTGIWWKSEVVIPFVRVQHSEVIQSPIERIFDLAKLKLYTAGGQTSDLSIPGLKPATAERLKNYITKKIALEEEE